MERETDRDKKEATKDIVMHSIPLIIILVIPVILMSLSGFLMGEIPACIAIFIGCILVISGIYNLTCLLPRMARDVKVSVSIEALRTSYWLVLIGLIIILLGISDLLNILPRF